MSSHLQLLFDVLGYTVVCCIII